MLKVFWFLAGRGRIVRRSCEPASADVLSHPAIERMAEREIADLPMRPEWPASPADAGRRRPCPA